MHVFGSIVAVVVFLTVSVAPSGRIMLAFVAPRHAGDRAPSLFTQEGRLALVGQRRVGESTTTQPPVTKEEQFLMLDGRAEMSNMAKYCMAHALVLAELLNRTFVAPTVRGGAIRDPDETALDALDFWELQRAAPKVRFVSMKTFLRQVPLQKADGHWLSAGGEARVHEEWPLRAEPEAALAKRLRSEDATVLILREDPSKNMCWMFGDKKYMHAARGKVYANLRESSKSFEEYASHMLSDHDSLSMQSALVVQWRSMTNSLMYTLQDLNPTKQLDSNDHSRHHQDCAQAVAQGADQILVDAGAQHVVLFSDIHTGCDPGGMDCGYREFDHLRQKHPKLEADRKAAAAYLAGRNWSSGDAMVSRYMREHPFRAGYESDSGVQGLLIEYTSRRAFALLTCTQSDCGHCGRAISGFSKSIVAMRMQSDETQCLTWQSWVSPQRPTGCPGHDSGQ
mmetsp:Transcript_122285/g.391230  ORF Transcript_122285/g.391230 Transcript_122285/m.391230 type:complete len:452 (-) Transcript_122285:445-1800(-)